MVTLTTGLISLPDTVELSPAIVIRKSARPVNSVQDARSVA